MCRRMDESIDGRKSSRGRACVIRGGAARASRRALAFVRCHPGRDRPGPSLHPNCQRPHSHNRRRDATSDSRHLARIPRKLGFRTLAFSAKSKTSSDESLIPLYRLQCMASRAWAVAHHQNAGSGQHDSASRTIRRMSFVLVAVFHDALVACLDGAGQVFAGFGGSDGAALPHLLVPAVCVCAATGTQLARRAGPHPGVFFGWCPVAVEWDSTDG